MRGGEEGGRGGGRHFKFLFTSIVISRVQKKFLGILFHISGMGGGGGGGGGLNRQKLSV